MVLIKGPMKLIHLYVHVQAETNTEEDDGNDAYLELGNVSPVNLISFVSKYPLDWYIVYSIIIPNVVSSNVLPLYCYRNISLVLE